MTEQENTQDNNPETTNSSVLQTILISFASSLVTLVIYVLLFQPLQMIAQQQSVLDTQQAEIETLKETVKISREELTKQMQLYIDENYGDISERDENIAKLQIYFKQQDARLTNIEEALSKF